MFVKKQHFAESEGNKHILQKSNMVRENEE